MPKEFSRTQRLGGQVQRELAQVIQQELRDPRVGFVTISAVELSRDLSHAKVFVTLMDPAQDVAETLRALNKAAGFLRRHLGQRMVMRSLPELRFVFDKSLDEGSRIDELLHQVAAEKKKDPVADTDTDGDKERD